MTRQRCPDDNELSAWALGHSPPDEAAAIGTHIEGCEACREVFGVLAKSVREGDATLPSALLKAPRVSLAPVLPGEVLVDKYEVLDVLGSGGMGVVLRAKHLQLNTVVALKFIRPELAHDADVVSRFSREARAASRLKSPHANRVVDLGMLPNGVPFMVMEYLEGETLEARLKRIGPLPEADVSRWMRQALDALQEAHGLGIVHRDLKPSNLFLQRRADGSEWLTVLDFGVAKSVNPDIEHGLQQTSLRGVVGSPAFMAPEQLTPGAHIDARADVWAIGATMQTLLSGRPPFAGADLVDLAWHIRNSTPIELPTTVSAGMNACIRRCLQRTPAARFQTATELHAALERLDTAVASRAGSQRWAVAVVGVALAAVWFGLRALSWAPDVRPAAQVAPESVPVSVPAAVAIPPAPSEAALGPLPGKSAAAVVKAPVAAVAPLAPVSNRPLRQATPVSPPPVVDAGVDDVYGERL